MIPIVHWNLTQVRVTIYKLVLTFRAELSCTLELRLNACFCFGNYFMIKNDELQPALNYIVNDVKNKTVLSIYCKIFKSIKIRSNSPEKTAHCKKYKTLDGPGCVTWYLFNKLLQPKSYQKEKHIILIVASVCEEAKEWSLLLIVREGGDGIKSSCRSLLKRSTNAMSFIVPYISKH